MFAEKSLHVVMSSISALCVSPKSGHKRDVKCKGGSYVVHDGDKASMELSNRLKLHRGQKKQAQGEKINVIINNCLLWLKTKTVKIVFPHRLKPRYRVISSFCPHTSYCTCH